MLACNSTINELGLSKHLLTDAGGSRTRGVDVEAWAHPCRVVLGRLDCPWHHRWSCALLCKVELWRAAARAWSGWACASAWCLPKVHTACLGCVDTGGGPQVLDPTVDSNCVYTKPCVQPRVAGAHTLQGSPSVWSFPSPLLPPCHHRLSNAPRLTRFPRTPAARLHCASVTPSYIWPGYLTHPPAAAFSLTPAASEPLMSW